MNLQTKKIELIQWLSSLTDVSVIDKIVELREQESTDWWLSLPSEEKESIEKGIVDANSGKLNKHKDVRKLYEKWL